MLVLGVSFILTNRRRNLTHDADTSLKSRFSFQEKYCIFVVTLPRAGADCELRHRSSWPRAVPEGRATIFSVLTHYIKLNVHLLQAVHVSIEVADNALQRVQSRFLRRHAMPHIFHAGMGAARPNIFFAAAGGSGAADVLVQP